MVRDLGMRRIFFGRVRGALILAVVLCGLTAAKGPAVEIGHPSDFCAQLNALAPGEELVLPPGEYRGPCTIRTGGLPGQPIVVRGQSPADRPRLVYDGRRSNVIDVKAEHVTIRGLAFGPTRENVDGIRIFSREGVTVEECDFSGLGGIAVVANHHNSRGLVVRRNIVRNTDATAMYFGCHDGVECVAEALLIEGNHIQTVRAPDPQIGYGIQIKLNSWGIVRDNVVVDSKGPGIMVYGAHGSDRPVLIERNVVKGSIRSSGIVLGGGPAVVRNNVLLGNPRGGISLEDYGRRGLLRGIVVVHNTLWQNEQAGIIAPAVMPGEVSIVNNAVQGAPGVPAWPAGDRNIRLAGNVDCAVAPCFTNAEGQDFSPMPTGMLAAAGAVRVDLWMPRDDFFGASRTIPPAVGAVERRSGPVRLAPRP